MSKFVVSPMCPNCGEEFEDPDFRVQHLFGLADVLDGVETILHCSECDKSFKADVSCKITYLVGLEEQSDE